LIKPFFFSHFSRTLCPLIASFSLRPLFVYSPWCQRNSEPGPASVRTGQCLCLPSKILAYSAHDCQLNPFPELHCRPCGHQRITACFNPRLSCLPEFELICRLTPVSMFAPTPSCFIVRPPKTVISPSPDASQFHRNFETSHSLTLAPAIVDPDPGLSMVMLGPIFFLLLPPHFLKALTASAEESPPPPPPFEHHHAAKLHIKLESLSISSSSCGVNDCSFSQSFPQERVSPDYPRRLTAPEAVGPSGRRFRPNKRARPPPCAFVADTPLTCLPSRCVLNTSSVIDLYLSIWEAPPPLALLLNSGRSFFSCPPSLSTMQNEPLPFFPSLFCFESLLGDLSLWDLF